MTRILSYLFVFLFIFSMGFSQNDAQAQGGVGVWIFDTTINPDVTPLEISGGGVFPDLDTFIVLNSEDLANLHVYNINRETRSLQSSSTIPVNTPAFGLSHNIRSANDTAHSCFVDNFQLYATHSQNAVDWDKVLVTNQFTNFSSCDTAVDNGNVYIGACNFDLFAYGIFESTDNGQTWNLMKVINNVRCAFSGGTRANFNMIDGEPVVFYMTGFPNGMKAVANDFENLATNDLLNTTRLQTDNELAVESGDDKEVVDTDSQGPPLAESYPGGEVGGVTVIPYYHRESNTVKIAVLDPDNPSGSEVIVLGHAPFFNLFFGISCVEGPEGTVNILFPGGNHFQYNTETGELTQISDTPFTNPNGPIATSDMIDTEMIKTNDADFNVAYQGDSFDYAQFRSLVRGIPTLGEWGLISLGLILLIIGAFYLRRRKARA